MLDEFLQLLLATTVSSWARELVSVGVLIQGTVDRWTLYSVTSVPDLWVWLKFYLSGLPPAVDKGSEHLSPEHDVS